MTPFTLVITIPVLAKDEQAAWEYGNELASRSVNRPNIKDDDTRESDVRIEEP